MTRTRAPESEAAEHIGKLTGVHTLLLHVLADAAQYRRRHSADDRARIFATYSSRVAHALFDRRMLVSEHVRERGALRRSDRLIGRFAMDGLRATRSRVRGNRGGDDRNGHVHGPLRHGGIDAKTLRDLLDGGVRDLLLNRVENRRHSFPG